MYDFHFFRSTLFFLCLCAVAILPSFLATANPIEAGEPITGVWVTRGYSSKVEISPCSANPNTLCGQVVWLWEAFDEQGHPMLDRKNPKKEFRSRPLIGIVILSDFQETSGVWTGGTIYNPEDGRTYRATLQLLPGDRLQVRGCVMFICQKQIWLRQKAFQ